jgi:PAS domain S-box-containing protein
MSTHLHTLSGLGGQIFDGYPAPTLIVDEDVRVLHVNRAARKVLGLEGDPHPALLRRGGEVLHCVHAYETDGCGRQEACKDCVIRNSVAQAFAHGCVQRSRANLELRQGNDVVDLNVLVSASPIQHDGAIHVVLTLEDVTEVVHLAQEVSIAERAVQETEAKLGTVVDNLAEGVVVSTLEGEIVHWNPPALAMHGFQSLDECRRRLPEFAKTFALADGDGRALAVEEWPLSRILRGEVLHDLELHVRRRETGKERIWRYSGSLARDSAGEPLMAVLTVRDITDERALQAQLAVASRLASMGTLVAGVAHEVNNPLAGSISSLAMATRDVRTFTDRLRTEVPIDREAVARGAEEVLELLNDAQEGTRRIARIVKDLSLFGRPDDQRHVARLIDVVDGAMRWLPASLRGAATVKVENRGAPDVMASGGQLEQVVVNLVANAAHAVRPGRPGHITIAIGPGSVGRARLDVADDGVGIAPELMTRIFDPFFTTREVGRGMGLGLPICHSIVTAHGGALTVTSDVGKGSTFRVELPAATADA